MSAESSVARLTSALSDRYRIDRELGAGGMATVYLAHDIKHDRDVAVKVLKPELGEVLGAERFLSEIKVTANLQHPNLLPLFDSGEADGLLYYVMPYIEGETLRTRLQREQQLPVDDVIRLITLMAAALDFAHARGVVHRDLKPENILLQAGQPVIADFGIALAVAQAGGDRITQTGMSLGTPHYMSPEQAAGERAVDARSDQYALAAMTYELLTGEPPHSGATAHVLIARVMTETPRSIRNARPAVPASVDAAVQRALSKAPADRFASCGDFAHALAAPTAAAAAPRTFRMKSIALAAGVIVVLGAAAFIANTLRSRDRAPTLVIGKSTQLTSDNGLEIQPAISPDGKLVAYSAGNSARMRVFIRPTNGGRTIPLSDDSTAVETHAQWSPDGSSLLFLSRRGVSVAPTLGGSSRAIVSSPGIRQVTSATWSPDGQKIAFARADSLFVTSSNGGAAVALAAVPDAHSCAWSPMGRFIACVSGNPGNVAPGPMFANQRPSAIVLIATESGAVTQLAEPTTFNQSPVWSPDGRRLLFVSSRDGPRDIYAQNVSTAGRAEGAPARLTTGLGAISIALSADGKRLVYAAYLARANVWSLPIPSTETVANAENAIVVTTGSQIIEGLSVSRDGRWLVYDSNIDGNANIFRLPLSGGEPERLTSDSTDEFVADLSPDGRAILYQVYRNGQRTLEIKPLDGGPVERPAKAIGPSYPHWSPDGQSLLFSGAQRGANTRIVRRTSTRQWGEPEVLLPFGLIASWSGDGNRLLYVVSPDLRKVDSVMVSDGKGGNPRRVWAAAPGTPAITYVTQWSVDSRSIFYKAHDVDGKTSFWTSDAEGRSLRMLVRFPNPERQSSGPDFAVSRTHIYFTIEDRQSDVYVAELIGK